MEAAIDLVWKSLYSTNSKIQAFAVSQGKEIVWQTSNWDPASDAETILSAPANATQSISINKVVYTRVNSDQESYIASGDGTNGHFLMALVDNNLWVLAWAIFSAVPELALIDLKKAAIDLKPHL